MNNQSKTNRLRFYFHTMLFTFIMNLNFTANAQIIVNPSLENPYKYSEGSKLNAERETGISVFPKNYPNYVDSILFENERTIKLNIEKNEPNISELKKID